MSLIIVELLDRCPVSTARCSSFRFGDSQHDSYFKARYGTYMRVPQIPNSGFNGVNGGMTVYYMQDGLYNFQQTSKVQAFQPVSTI
jgi:hypothetical protein